MPEGTAGTTGRMDNQAAISSVLEETAVQDLRFRPRVDSPAGEHCLRERLGSSLGAYRIERLLGRGSMACVYKARHLGLDRDCALKILDSSLDTRQPGLREQFWAEARAAANLVHPHVVTVHNIDSADGYHFIEMEYVPGGRTLRDVMVHEGPLDASKAAILARQITLALGAAHDSGLVHRDIKPANVLLTERGVAKLADFGLVRRLDELARGGAPLAGTPTYMAPELFEGVPASPRSDFYAVGVLLFYCLSGRLPLVSDSVGQLIQLHRTQAIPEIRSLAPAVPEALAQIVTRALARDPEERFVNADEMADALQGVILRLREVEALVRECVEGLNCFIQGYRNTFRIIVPLPGDRLQEVVVEASKAPNEAPILTVFSVCAPADPAYFQYALRLNSQLTYGSISVHDVLGSPMFVMSRTFSLDTVHADDLRGAILEIARRSDRIEKQLTRMDQY